MQDLRLVGVHDDGEHLLVSGTGGEMFRLPIDEALRAAASRTQAKAPSGVGAAPIAMSPRDIQARIRSGATADEVAELSGIPLAKVQRYEGPVLAEREYVAQQARKIEVASPSAGHDSYRSYFGDQPATLDDMVTHRLRAHGVEPSTVEWDSWRRPDGSWNVVARFDAPSGAHAAIGEEPPAMWTFSPARKSLQNANRWAQQLSELEPIDGPVPARRLSAVSDRPFDFETDAEAAARTATAQLSVVHPNGAHPFGGPQEKDADGLLDMLRSRRGQRLGLDEDADDALALLLTNGVPAAHPRPSEVPPPEDSGDDDTEVPGEPAPAAEEQAPAAKTEPHAVPDAFARRRDARPSMLSRLSLAPRHQDTDGDDALKLHDGVSTETREITIAASQLRPVRTGPTSSPGLDELLGGGPSRRAQADSPADSPAGDAPVNGPSDARASHQESSRTDPARGDREHETPERQPSKPKRSSVPSWDEIVFGTRSD